MFGTPKMPSKPLLRGVLTALTLSMTGVFLLSPSVSLAQTPPIFDYGYYVDKASEFTKQGELSRAIEMYEKARPLAPETSVTVVQNNLAVIYMKRGNYLLNKAGSAQDALSDFRKAYFLMEYDWPEGEDKKALHADNTKIAKDNVRIAYNNLGIKPDDADAHLKQAKELRLQGKFQEAVVEYGQVAEAAGEGNKALSGEAYQSMGDLFNVMNRPQKSKSYYQKAVVVLGKDASDDLYVRLGNAQNKAGDVEVSVQSLNKALEINPDNISALNQLENIWQREIKFNPTSVLGHANLASVYQKKKLFQDALRQYNTAEYFAERNPTTPFETKKLLRLNIGTLHQEAKQFPVALRAYDTVLQIEPDNELALYYRATAYRDMGNVPEAIQAYKQLLTLHPKYENAYEDLFALIKNQPDPRKVSQDLKEYAAKFPDNALVQSKIGEEFHRMKDYDTAAFYYQRAISVDPKMAAAYANLGAVYQAQGKDEEAFQTLKKATELDPKNETVVKLAANAQKSTGYKHYEQAVELQNQGKVAEALPYYEKALALDPANDDIRLAYAVALQNQEKFKEALIEYRKVQEEQTNNGDIDYYMATAYHQSEDYEKAIAAYNKAVDKGSQYADTARQAVDQLKEAMAADAMTKAVDAYGKSDYSGAWQWVQKAIDQKPDNATAFYYKGLILSSQSKEREAVTSYKEAIKRDPAFRDAYYALGVSLDKTKNPLDAKSAFQKFIELSAGVEDDFTKYARDRVSGQ